MLPSQQFIRLCSAQPRNKVLKTAAARRKQGARVLSGARCHPSHVPPGTLPGNLPTKLAQPRNLSPPSLVQSPSSHWSLSPHSCKLPRVFQCLVWDSAKLVILKGLNTQRSPRTYTRGSVSSHTGNTMESSAMAITNTPSPWHPKNSTVNNLIEMIPSGTQSLNLHDVIHPHMLSPISQIGRLRHREVQ